MRARHVIHSSAGATNTARD
uniref:Uncharacterized protein n=1 Tax=Oryza nivara TaxID=4536 RepID=A0A0E0J0H4_ORYNI